MPPDKGRTVFLVSPFVPFPPARGIELRIYRLLKWMKQAGYRVVLIVPTELIEEHALRELSSIAFAVHWTRPAYRTRLGARFPFLRRMIWEPAKPVIRYLADKRRAVLDTAEDSDNDAGNGLAKAMNSGRKLGDEQIKAWFASDKLVQLVASLARKYQPHAVIVEYIFSTPVLGVLPPGTLTLIDTIDVFSRKEDQVLAFGIADPLACSEEEERRQLLKGDVIVAIQSREARLLKELVPERQVILAGMDFDVMNTISSAPIANRIVVVASDNPLNVHGLSEFLTACWPNIKKLCSGATLHVVGKVGDMCRIDDPSIQYSGWVDDLDAIYREASVVINPTIAGTGLKIKSVQALAHGKPLVAWTNGVEGLDYEGSPPYRVCESWTTFAEAVVSLLKSDDERRALEKLALEYAKREFGADKTYAALRVCLDGPAPSRANSDRSEFAASRGAAAVG